MANCVRVLKKKLEAEYRLGMMVTVDYLFSSARLGSENAVNIMLFGS